MKRSLAKFLGITYLFAATHLMTISCASSDEGGDEEVAAEGDNNAADADGNNAENNNGNNGNNGNGEGNNATAGNNEFGNGAEGGNATAGAEGTAMNDAGAAGGDAGTQQIIDEMNQAGGKDAAAAADGAAPQGQGFDNLAQNGAGKDGAAPAAASAPSAPAAASAPSAPAAPGLPELGSKMSYMVQKGDTLAKIAQRIYGDVNKWTEIAEFTGLANPKLIYPGDVVYYQLTEKTQTFATAYESVARSEVQVGQGDTLATISSKVYGNSSLWKLIWRQNDKIDNPDKLVAGTKIFYVDQAKLAQLDKEVSAKFAQDKVEVSKAKVSKVEVSKSKKVAAQKVKTIEVANDLFSNAAANQTLVKSLI